MSHMLVGAKVCDLTEDHLWFVCGNFDVFPYRDYGLVPQMVQKLTVFLENVV